jgi:predicted dehydrogenase
MSTSVSDAEAMIAACKAANVKLMIAYRCQYEPTNLRAIQLIRDGALGKVQVIQSGFGGNFAAGEWRLTKKYGGGGSLMDVGIYALNASRYLTGEEPVEFSAYTSTLDQDGKFAEVDENVVWNTKFPSGILANCSSTYGASMPGYYRVYGSKGWLEVGPAFSYDGLRLQARYSSGVKGSPEVRLDELNSDKDPIHFTREADHFTECILKNQTPKTPGEEGLRDMRYIKEIYRTAGVTVL